MSGGVLIGGGGTTASQDYRRLALAQAVATADPSTKLNSALSDGGDGVGITFDLAGLWTGNGWDAGGYGPNVWWNLTDILGDTFNGAKMWAVTAMLRIRTHPGSTSDFRLGVAFSNTTDVTTSTGDARACGMEWASSTRKIWDITVAGGTPSGGSSSSPDLTMTGLTINFRRPGISSTAYTGAQVVYSSFDSSGAALATNSNFAALTVDPASQFYIGMYAYRNNVINAATALVKADLYVWPVVASSWPS